MTGYKRHVTKRLRDVQWVSLNVNWYQDIMCIYKPYDCTFLHGIYCGVMYTFIVRSRHLTKHDREIEVWQVFFLYDP